MQWICILAGLLLGWGLDESFNDALIGALIGLGIGQWTSLQRLHTLLTEQQAKLEQTRADLSSLEQQVTGLATGLSPSVPLDQSELPVEATVAQMPEPEPEPEPAEFDLVWELPPEVIAAEPYTAPQPEDLWAAQAPLQAVVHKPNLIERGILAARNWLIGGNTVLRVGVVLLFFGLAFLLRYATEGVVVPIELRYAGVAAAALALLALGWWLRLRNTSYALILQGTGIAVLYLTVFAAMRLHPLLTPAAALGLLVAVTLFSAILAVTQNALALACVAALGGFSAPILTSTGSGDHVALFSYFALLNAGILAIAWFKAWRVLNLIGFVSTFGIGFAWGLKAYTPELLWSTEPFLILFFLMYLAIGLLFTRRKLLEMKDEPASGSRTEWLIWSARKADYLDGTMLFGPPLIGFGLQFALVQHLEFAAAFSALILGFIYLGIARLLSAGRALLLTETCLALGVIFASLAIPLGLDARWTSAAWAVEGAGLYWLGLRQNRPLARAFALLLQLGSALAFLGELRIGQTSLLDGAPLGALMLGAALLFSFYQLRNTDAEKTHLWEQKFRAALACSGLGFLYLLAPLFFFSYGTAMCWALAGLLTLFVGLRLQSKTFLFTAFAVQLLGAGLFLLRLQGSSTGSGAVLDAGLPGMLSASIISLALIAGMLFAARDDLIRTDKRLLNSLSVVLLAGLALINLAVLFVLPWRTASAIWAASGLLIIWLSLYLQQRVSFVFGLALQIIGASAFLFSSQPAFDALASEGLAPLGHSGFWSPMVLGLAAMAGAWRLQLGNHASAFDSLNMQRLSRLLLVWGAAWWAFAIVSEVMRFAPVELRATLLLGICALSVALWAWLALRLKWPGLGVLSCMLIPAASWVLAQSWHAHYHPAANFGWLAWTAIFAVHFISLRRLAPMLLSQALSAAHVLGCWLLIGVLALELRYGLLVLSEHYNAWRWLGWAILPSAYLLLMSLPRAWPWPISAYTREYRLYAALPLAVLMLGWFWLANIASDGSAEPLPYLPLLNPLEIGLLLALFSLYLWSRSALGQCSIHSDYSSRITEIVCGASLFAFFTALVMRSAHQWGGVPFELQPLLKSMLVQAGLSIVWTLIALSLMVSGHLRHRRDVWLTGAGLIAVVVAKLIFVELSNRGGLERIVSFIGVGVLLLIVGYFAPLPPKRAEKPLEQDNESQGVSP